MSNRSPIFKERQEDREQLVEQYLIPNGIHDPKVIAAMKTVPRHHLVAADIQEEAYNDYPLSIGFQQTISQPLVVAKMTQQLNISEGERVLEIGTGSGYQAAILRELGAKVYSIEIFAPLSFRAQHLLEELGYDDILFRIGDGYYGWPEQAPFDAIIMTTAPDRIPQNLIDQLKEKGGLILPLGKESQNLLHIQKDGDQLHWQNLGPVSFVGMVGRIDA